MWSRCVASQLKHNSWFVAGAVLGVWLGLALVPLEEPVACVAAPDPAPRLVQRPAPAVAPARSPARPRYYSTELGIRDSLLAGVLCSDPERAAALNVTAAALQPALKLFAAAGGAVRAPNVVAFTDTREMLRPFHALKYLADNYLEEYDFFFLSSDVSLVNAPRLQELARGLSVSQDVYMGVPASDENHYCTLEGGILLSNSVLRAVHHSLEWCVRNSYSAHHHENIGRCVVHAADVKCVTHLQGQHYAAEPDGPLRPALAQALTIGPLPHPRRYHTLHAYVARVQLQQISAKVAAAADVRVQALKKAPRTQRRAGWPPGLRAEAGDGASVGAGPAATRFDLLRYTPFNDTHALLLDETRAASPLPRAHRLAARRALAAARALLGRRLGPGALALQDAAWRWEPAARLSYRLVFRHEPSAAVRALEVSLPLGAARLRPVPYVTESARVTLVLALRPTDQEHSPLLRRLKTQPPHNLEVIVSWLYCMGDPAAGAPAGLRAVRAEVACGAEAAAVEVPALRAALPLSPHDALLLLVTDPELDLTDEFLNRVRMNTIQSVQWFAPGVFVRYPHYYRELAAARTPSHNTGRFQRGAPGVLAAYRTDLEAALSSMSGSESLYDALSSSGLQCVRAPEPGGSSRGPRAPPARGLTPSSDVQLLMLGAPHALAKMLLEAQDQ